MNIFRIDTSILDMLFFFLWHFTTLQFRCKPLCIIYVFVCACGCVCAQSHLTLCKPIDCSLPSSSVWNFPGKNTGTGCHFLLQGIFLTQGSNLSPFVSCTGRWILYHCTWEAYIHNICGEQQGPTV